MLLKVISFIPCQYIADGHAYSLSLPANNEFFLIEALDDLIVVDMAEEKPVKRGTLVIGRISKLINFSGKPAGFRGIAFRLIQKSLLLSKTRYITGNPPVSYTVLKEYVNQPFLNNEVIHALENALEQFLRAALEEKKACRAMGKRKLSGKIDKRLITVNRYIRQHYEEPITLQTLADLIACHPVYLSQMYSKVFNTSPLKHLQTVRMQKAKEFLLYTNLTIAEITHRTGYVTHSQFGTLFKKTYGVTPHKCRINHMILTRNRTYSAAENPKNN